MSYQVKQGNIAGRIGTGFGQGLAEQIPKETERLRLSQGLEKLGQQKGLTPFQQLGQLATLPGVTPQLIQSGSELLKQQGIGEAYGRRAGRENIPMDTQPPGNQNFRNVEFAPGQGKKQQGASPSPEYGQPQISPSNPLREAAQPRAPWSQQRLNQEIARNFQEFPGITQPEAISLAKDAEQRELAQPVGEQARDTYNRDVQARVTDKFKNFLETKLQKTGPGVFKDVTGENLVNLQRGMERDLRMDPNASEDDVADRWSTKALDLSKTKNQMDTLASNFEGRLNPLKRGQQLGSLEKAQKIFADTGNLEEYWNKLQTDFGLSPEGAASIAYPLSKTAGNYVNHAPITKGINANNFAEKVQTAARQHAEKVKETITSSDSPLSIGRKLRERDPLFNEAAFFDELSQDMDRFTPQQQREITQAQSRDWFPNWGDILILPLFKERK